MSRVIRTALLDAAGTAAYIAILVTGAFYAPTVDAAEDVRSILIPIGMLCLFVLSAAVTGFLVFGRPLLWYLDGQRKEAVGLVSWTLAFLAAIVALVFVAVLVVARY